MRITGRQLRQIIKEEVSRSLLSEANAAAVQKVRAYRAAIDQGKVKDIDAHTRKLAMDLKGLGVVGFDAIIEVLGAVPEIIEGETLAAELASMQK